MIRAWSVASDIEMLTIEELWAELEHVLGLNFGPSLVATQMRTLRAMTLRELDAEARIDHRRGAEVGSDIDSHIGDVLDEIAFRLDHFEPVMFVGGAS